MQLLVSVLGAGAKGVILEYLGQDGKVCFICLLAFLMPERPSCKLLKARSPPAEAGRLGNPLTLRRVCEKVGRQIRDEVRRVIRKGRSVPVDGVQANGR